MPQNYSFVVWLLLAPLVILPAIWLLLRPGAEGERYLDARECERRGEIERARELYRGLRDFMDAETRLGRLEVLSEKELTRISALTPGRSLTATAGEGIIAGRYRFLKPLGAGGMGYVFQARDERLGRLVALKRVNDSVAGSAVARELLYKEAKTQASLPSTYILPLHDILADGGELFLVFEFIDGRSLADHLAEEGPMAPGRARDVLVYVCRGLADAHDAGIVHRDLKPSNIMERKGGSVVVMDFGIAVRGGGDGVVAGTPPYMAPEQEEGVSTPRSDLFALGVTAYEMLAGRRPFSGPDIHSAKRVGDYAPLPPSVPKSLRSVIASCLQADPAERPESARSVEEALNRTA